MPSSVSLEYAIKEYLQEHGFALTAPLYEGETSFRGKYVTNGIMFDTIISLPPVFPVDYPTFHLVDTDMVFKEPHIERPIKHKGQDFTHVCRVCIRSENEKTYNPNPVDLLYEMIHGFYGLCDKLACKSFDSKTELFEEFDSYWPQGTTAYYYFNNPPQNHSRLHLIEIGYPLVSVPGNQFERTLKILTDNPGVVAQFAAKSGQEVFFHAEIPYVDLGDSFTLPLPYTYNQMRRILKKVGSMNYLDKFKAKVLGNMILIGFNLPSGEKHFAGIEIPRHSNVPVKGMRKVAGVSNYQVFTNPLLQNNEMLGMAVKSLQRSWLMERGGSQLGSNTYNKGRKIVIAGVGSIGASLAFKLCKSGVNHITLIDPGIMRPENVGRHLLGLDSIGRAKAKSVAAVLRSQYIEMDVNYILDTAQSDSAIEVMKEADLIITAIGSDAPSVEPWLSENVQNGTLPPMITCWVEAYAVAGHALLIKPGDNFFFDSVAEGLDLLDPEYAYLLKQKEVGCNSEYMPYMHVDADVHVNRMAKFILKFLNDSPDIRAMNSYGDTVLFSSHLNKEVQPDGYEEIEDEAILL